jgi:hypothetical protein
MRNLGILRTILLFDALLRLLAKQNVERFVYGCCELALRFDPVRRQGL